MKSPKLEIWKFYLYVLFKSADVKRGVFIIYWLHLGFSNLQVGMLQTALFWSNLLTEIPTGILADRFSRRTNLIVGCGLRALNGLGYLYFGHFEMFLLLSILSGVSFSFFSGTDEAYLFEYLQNHGGSDSYSRIQSRAKALSSLSLAAAIVTGGYLQKLSWTSVFAVFLAMMMVGALCAALLPNEKHMLKSANADESEDGLASFSTLFRFFHSSAGRHLFWLILAVGLFEAAYTPYFIFSQSVLTSLNLSPAIVTNLLAVIELGTFFSYWIAGGLSARISLPRLFAFTFPFLAIVLALNAFALPWLSLVCLALAMLVPTIFFIALETYFHSQIPSRIRATFFSVNSLVNSLFISFTYLGLGYLLDRIPEAQAIAWLALLPIVGLVGAGFYFSSRGIEWVKSH